MASKAISFSFLPTYLSIPCKHLYHYFYLWWPWGALINRCIRHGKEYWCQYVRSRRLNDERRILRGLNNRLWSWYWAMGWLLSVWASCDWALMGRLPDVYSSSNKEERTRLLLVHACELLCVFPEINTRKGETRGDSEAQLRTASVQSIGV